MVAERRSAPPIVGRPRQPPLRTTIGAPRAGPRETVAAPGRRSGRREQQSGQRTSTAKRSCRRSWPPGRAGQRCRSARVQRPSAGVGKRAQAVGFSATSAKGASCCVQHKTVAVSHPPRIPAPAAAAISQAAPLPRRRAGCSNARPSSSGGDAHSSARPAFFAGDRMAKSLTAAPARRDAAHPRKFSATIGGSGPDPCPFDLRHGEPSPTIAAILR